MPHKTYPNIRGAESCPTSATPHQGWRRLVRTAVIVACWGYAIALLALWTALRGSRSGNWLAHLWCYGPQWLVAAPWPLLAAGAAALRRPRLLLPLTLALGAIVSLTGFSIPVQALRLRPSAAGSRLRVLTCNVQGHDLRTDRLGRLIRESAPALVVLQECRQSTVAPVLGPDGWHVRSEGEFTVASRFPIQDFEALHAPDDPHRIVAVRARIIWSGQVIPIVAVHLMTPRDGLQEVLDSRRAGIKRVQEVLAVQQRDSRLARSWTDDCGESVVVGGDFNLTVQHPLYRRDWRTMSDAYSTVGFGLGHTMFTRRIGLRIDHVLCGRNWRPARCRVAYDVGSAHRPLLADLVWEGPAGSQNQIVAP